jgi:hypothetical protein
MIESPDPGSIRMSIVAEPAAHRSRWGWHAVGREAFLQVKEYHRLLYRAFRQHRRWEAWDRKTVHRTGPEPVQAVEFTAVDRWSGRRLFLKFGDPIDGPTLYHHVLAEYRKARRPVARPEMVEPLDLPQGWATQLEKLRAHFED